jgi:DNA repair protein SbcC/Rad50
VTVQVAHIGLRNIRSYRSAQLRLGPGTTLLSGDIGSGKTSLLYAVEMALLGFAEVEPGYLVRHGAREAEVSLTLTDGEHRWELRRKFTRRARKGHDTFEPTENSLSIDGQRTVYSATELRRRTIELLGFPDNPNPRAHSDVWRWAVYLAQERMRDVLNPDVDVRMETVRKALGVEQYRLAAENARGLSRSLQDRAANLDEQGARHRGVEDEANRWQQEEAAARRALEELAVRERALREELDQARVVLEATESERREVEAGRQALAHLERLAEELHRSIEQDQAAQQAARERLARIEADRTLESAGSSPVEEPPHALEPLRTRRERLVLRLTELEQLRGQASGVDEQLERSTNRERELAARHAVSIEQVTSLRAEERELALTDPVVEPHAADDRSRAQLLSDRNRLEDERRGVDRRLATAVLELQELSEMVQQGVCPRCHRPVEASEFESHRREQETLVGALQAELDAASRRLLEADAGLTVRLEYERSHDRWQELEARRSDLRQRESALQTSLADEEYQIQQLAVERAGLESRRAALAGQLEEVHRVREEIALVEKELVGAEERARASAARKERLAALERLIPEVTAEIENRMRSEADRTVRWKEVLVQVEAGRERVRVSPDLEERWRALRLRFEDRGRAVEALLREATGPHGKLAEASARLDELARRLAERQRLEREAAALRRLSHWVDKDFRNAMAELERRRLEQGRRQFERAFAQYFAALVEDPALSARVDEDFAPWVDIAGQPTPAEALSGGERTALALAYRLALGRTVRDAGRLTLETLILDEPTEGFSQEQTLRMGDLLEELRLSQVILVSHERQLEGVADRVVRIRKKDGTSVIEEEERPVDGTPTSEPRAGPAGPPARVPTRRRKIRRLSDLGVPAAVSGPAQLR